MAEPIGVTAGLIGIATFAFQISKELYDLVDSIQKAPQTIRDLKSELAALDPILKSIQEVITLNASNFEDIRYPLHQCSMVCFHLKTLIRQCTEHSATSRSARDWVKMQYKGKTIEGYKGRLASYKATIGIAMSTYTLMSTTTSAEAVEELKATIHDAINQAQPDIEVQIDGIMDSLHSLVIEKTALREALHKKPSESSTRVVQEQESALERQIVDLELEKKAMEQSQKVCAENKEVVDSKEGHRFINNLATNEASAQYGDYVAKGYTGKVGAVTNHYERNQASQKANVMYGTNYGGLSVFDD